MLIYDDIWWYMLYMLIYVDVYTNRYMLIYVDNPSMWQQMHGNAQWNMLLSTPCYCNPHFNVLKSIYVSWFWFNSIPTKPGLMCRCVIAPRIHMFENSCSNQQLGLQEELINATCQRMTAMSSWRCVACVQFVMWAVFKTENGTPLYWSVHGLW